jgi:hypothetical protein
MVARGANMPIVCLDFLMDLQHDAEKLPIAEIASDSGIANRVEMRE